MGWYEHAFVYQVYPLGACGCAYEAPGEAERDGEASAHRILRLASPAWVDHLKGLGVTCVMLNPVFASESHGYDTTDYAHVDPRLGTDADLATLVSTLHAAGIRVMLDGVFNHVGRSFWAFADVLENRRQSRYQDWFRISWDGDTGYHDGLWYDSWQGCENLVRLNLENPEVRGYLLDVVRGWVRDFDIDGLRLDVAYCLDQRFLRDLRHLADELTADPARAPLLVAPFSDDRTFTLMGETMFGDYNQWMGDDTCHSVTNYECYKGLWSSMNSANMHEVAYAMNRQSGSDPWCLYTGRHLLDFLDNHDVTRIATQLDDKRRLTPLYGLLFGMPGVPCVYYGSEWGMEGEQRPYEHEIRPEVEAPEQTDLTRAIAAFAAARARSEALCDGSYREVACQPLQLVFERAVDGERVLVAMNAADSTAHLDFDAGCGQAVDLVSGDIHDFGGGSDLPPFSCAYWRCER